MRILGGLVRGECHGLCGELVVVCIVIYEIYISRSVFMIVASPNDTQLEASSVKAHNFPYEKRNVHFLWHHASPLLLLSINGITD
jgi:hypothetical protein